MARFTLPRDLYHGEGSLAELKNLKGKKAVVVVGGGPNSQIKNNEKPLVLYKNKSLPEASISGFIDSAVIEHNTSTITAIHKIIFFRFFIRILQCPVNSFI